MFYSIDFEKDRTLSRHKAGELWLGTIDGAASMLHIAPAKSSLQQDYFHQTRLQHSVVLQPHLAAVRKKSYRVSIPLQFSVEKIPDVLNLDTFAAQLFSLIYALNQKHLDVRWNPRDLI